MNYQLFFPTIHISLITDKIFAINVILKISSLRNIDFKNTLAFVKINK